MEKSYFVLTISNMVTVRKPRCLLSRKLDIKSTIKYSNNGCTRQASNPQFIAENVLNREFTASAPNEKWLTDVTEFKYYIDGEKHKFILVLFWIYMTEE